MTSWMERVRNGETVTDTERGRAIMRCSSCKTVGTISYTMTRSTRMDRVGRFHHAATVQADDAAREKTVDASRSNPLAWALHRNCPSCGSGHVDVRVVKGTVVESKACDARCMGATGPSCSCSCGGENHGGSHGAFAVAS